MTAVADHPTADAALILRRDRAAAAAMDLAAQATLATPPDPTAADAYAALAGHLQTLPAGAFATPDITVTRPTGDGQYQVGAAATEAVRDARDTR